MQTKKFYNLFRNHHLLNTETLSELKDLVEKNPYFQPGWMLYLKNLKQENSQDFEKELKKSAVHISERKLLFRFLHTEENMFKKLPERDIESQTYFNLEGEKEEPRGDSLIDKFLSSEAPSIRRNYTDSDTQGDNPESDIVKNSLSEDDEMVTETLAMLYYQQKKYDKALDAFKKLSLKYPEKSVYFATRIEEIEKLKNI